MLKKTIYVMVTILYYYTYPALYWAAHPDWESYFQDFFFRHFSKM